MITFFEPKPNSSAECFDGSYPFIHWAGPFSTGVIRYKSLYILSDQATLRARLDSWDANDWVFALYNKQSGADVTDYDQQEWLEVSDVVSGSVTLRGTESGVNSLYYYQLIVVCRSDVEGEYIENLYINEIPYKIGVEFWGENENLKINLANIGVEIPELITKALYPTDVYEDDTDWVLLNRKFRELLISHMELLDNKGSYKSLENALQWFEYGNLAELREVWKYETPDGTKMYDQPIGKFVSTVANQQMFNSAKTTYFALRSLKRVSGEGEGFIPTLYDTDALENPTTKGLISRWSEDEMRLKMVLLGDFLETYFMPIHTELVRSVVEDISSHITYLGWGSSDIVMEECFTEANDFDVDWSSDQEDEKSSLDLSDPTYHLDVVHVNAGLPRSEAYGQALENDGTILLSQDAYKDMQYAPIIACHVVCDADATTDEDIEQALEQSLGQIYNGIGAVITGNFEFEEPIISGSCEGNQWGEFVTTSFSESSPSNKFSISFLFPHAGEYKMSFRFKGQSGKYYTKVCTFTIKDNVRVNLKYYALAAAVDRSCETPNPFTADPAALYNTTRTLETSDYTLEELEDSYKVFLADQAIANEEESGIRYSAYIPVRSSTDKTYHWQAPYATVMRTCTWSGRNSAASLYNFCTANKSALNNCWFSWNQGLMSSYIRIVPRYRDQPLPTFDTRTANLLTGVAYNTYDKDVFLPEVHKLVPVPSDVCRDIPVVCQPTAIIELSQNGTQVEKRVPYSYICDSDPAWEFYSCSRVRNIQALSDNICDPFIAWPYNEPLPLGFYKITFRYKVGDEVKTIKDTPSWRLVDKYTPLSYEQYVPTTTETQEFPKSSTITIV